MTNVAQDPPVRIARSESGEALDLFIEAAPSSTREDQRGQFASMVEGAHRALREHGLGPGSIVSGWIRFASAPAWDWRAALADAWQMSGVLPITALLQPPAEPFRACSLGLHAVRSARQSGVWHGPSASPAAATFLRDGARHLRLMSVTARAELRKTASFAELAYDMFAQAGHALTARGLAVADVVRTWIHVHDIEANYASLNQARSRYFQEQALVRLPASTCVEGTPLGVDVPVMMDLYAVSASSGLRVEAMSPATMCEASAYGSAFSRATRLWEPGRRWLFVSGTASINAQGQVVAVGDVRGQLRCMFEHVGGLLAEAEMGFADALSVVAYLKRADYLAEFVKAARASGLGSSVPCAVTVADICRPEWLCEVELCASRSEAIREPAVETRPPG
jgi:enamine deaminase RidA (YjgF/YER057c/UK114 family)